jgi:O-antigen/teichoic acid export membrane protein
MRNTASQVSRLSGRQHDREASSSGPPATRGTDLIRRAPAGYLWNQAFSLWLYVSLLLYELVVRRSLPLRETGIWDLASTAANMGVYVASLGLTTAAAVYLPRALADGGPGYAMRLALRLVVLRLAGVAIVALAILWVLPAVAGLLGATGLPGMAALSRTLNDPTLRAHRVVIAGMVVGTGIANLLAALLTSLLRTRTVFIAGGLAQLMTIVLAYLFINPLGGGADGALSALVLPSALVSVIYALAIRKALAAPSLRGPALPMGPVLRMGIASWFADLANGALFKPLVLWQLAFSVSLAQIPLFASVFQMGHGAALVLLTGISGVSMSIMSAAYMRRQRTELAAAWRAICKLQIILTVPLMCFAIPHASAIMPIFGANYESAGALLALFLALNVVVQLAGSSTNESALFVLDLQRWVVVSRWGALGLLAVGDVLLIPRLGVEGALISVALCQLVAAIFLLVITSRAVGAGYPFDFILKILGALVLPVAFGFVWRPTWVPLLVVAGLGYGAVLLLALRLIRPLDAEDRLLLNQVAAPIRAILLPFAAPERSTPPSSSPPGDSRPLPLAATSTGSGTGTVPPYPLPADTQPNPWHSGQ